MRRRALGLVLSLGILVGCASSGEQAPPASSGDGDEPVASDMVRPVGGDLRLGQTWYLLGGLVSELGTPTTSPVTLQFDQDRAGGQGPVNSYSAEYTAEPTGSLTFGMVASTLMAGPPEATAAETAYFAALAEVDGYTTVQAGQLYLFEGEDNVLVFSTTPAPDEPMVSGAILAVAEQVIGMTEREARAAIEDAGYLVRVISRDGEMLPHTDDYTVTRVNLALVKGRVTQATVG